MRFAVRIIRMAVVTFASAVLLAPVGLAHAASGEEVINARVDFMKEEMQGHWKPLAAFAKSGQGSLADVEKNARALVAIAKKIPGHFPKDTGRGNFPDDLTRALPAIWKDWSEFEKSIQRLATESEKLAQLAKDGNKDAVVAMIGDSGGYGKTKIGCAECHEKFQGPRVKK